MSSFLSKLFPNRTLSRLESVVSSINDKEGELEKLDDNALRLAAQTLKKEIRDLGGSEEDLKETLPKAFALVRETARRTLKQRHFDAQLIGGAVLHEGKIAQMLTGEGKTLVATLPVSLNALAGRGVHVVTVNDYLAKRDVVWMGQIYHALGLSVSCIVHDAAYMYDPAFEGEKELDTERDVVGSFKVVEKFLRPISRKEAYNADITYGTNHEFGFDFLRDNLTLRVSDQVQRGHHYAIIDEVDSILIDEARTPLIIAAPDQESSEYYKVFTKIVERLSPEADYIVDEKLRTVSIIDEGIEKVEKTLGIQNIFSPENSRLVHFLHESLKAKALFQKDRDYIVKDNEVYIVDQ
ncbi:MAG: preprotein translocase subunit SecA, partial [Patescibacteria group bacterium]